MLIKKAKKIKKMSLGKIISNVFTILSFSLVLFGAGVLILGAILKSGVDYKDIYYNLKTEKFICPVETENIYNVKDKGRFYDLVFEIPDRSPIRLEKISQKEYEQLIGTGNNSIETECYELQICLYRKSDYMGWASSPISIGITRYAFLGQTNFSAEEIERYSEIALKEYRKKENKKVDVLTPENTNSYSAGFRHLEYSLFSGNKNEVEPQDVWKTMKKITP